MTNKLEIVEHGVMLSDYFSGTSGVWINISLDKNTTIAEVIGQLESECYLIWDHIDFTADQNNFDGDLDQQIDDQLAQMRDYCKDKMNKPYNADLEWEFSEDETGYQEYPVLIFAIEFKTE